MTVKFSVCIWDINNKAILFSFFLPCIYLFPQVLVLTGIPAHRPPLIDFANLITKKLSLLICGHVVMVGNLEHEMLEKLSTFFYIQPPGSIHLPTQKESTQAWMNERKIKGFYTVTENTNFEQGAKSCLTLAGLGKLAPNMLLVGFKTDWADDLDSAKEYFSVLQVNLLFFLVRKIVNFVYR